jgi:hypothetical protein
VSFAQKKKLLVMFFECTMAKYIWSLFAYSFGTNCSPNSLDQELIRIKINLPHGKQVYTVGLAAICFALWRTRNSVLKAREPNAQ